MKFHTRAGAKFCSMVIIVLPAIGALGPANWTPPLTGLNIGERLGQSPSSPAAHLRQQFQQFGRLHAQHVRQFNYDFANAAPPATSPDPIRATPHREIHFAGGAGYIITRRFTATQHCPGIAHFLMIETGAEPIGEGIAAEVAPEVSAAAQIFPVPIDLRIVPELMTNRA